MYSVRDSVKRISEGFSERFSHRFTERFRERFSKRCSERHSERHSERFSETLHVHFIIFGVDAGVICFLRGARGSMTSLRTYFSEFWHCSQPGITESRIS